MSMNVKAVYAYKDKEVLSLLEKVSCFEAEHAADTESHYKRGPKHQPIEVEELRKRTWTSKTWEHAKTAASLYNWPKNNQQWMWS